MKKLLKNKKGFTLVELLAVIVVLAIIMVIAVTQVNSTIKKSRTNSFLSSYKMLVKEIKSRMAMEGLGDAATTIACSDAASCATLYDISSSDYDMVVTANGTNGYKLDLTGKGKFANMEGLKDSCPVTDACPNSGNAANPVYQQIKVIIDSNGTVTKQ